MASCRYQDGLTETQISRGTLEYILPLDFRDTKKASPDSLRGDAFLVYRSLLGGWLLPWMLFLGLTEELLAVPDEDSVGRRIGKATAGEVVAG